jgi:hypothetical protein
MKGTAEMSAPMLGSLLVAAAGWLVAAYLAVQLWAANDYIHLIQSNRARTQERADDQR